jgi:hypothetical protein
MGLSTLLVGALLTIIAVLVRGALGLRTRHALHAHAQALAKAPDGLVDEGPDHGKNQAVRERNRQFARLGREGEQDVGRKRHEKQNKHNEKKGVHSLYTIRTKKSIFILKFYQHIQRFIYTSTTNFGFDSRHSSTKHPRVYALP